VPCQAEQAPDEILDSWLRAHLPADMRGGKIEFGNVGNRRYQVVLRVSELRRGLQGYRTCRIADVNGVA
jgi:hypothetical protein